MKTYTTFVPLTVLRAVQADRATMAALVEAKPWMSSQGQLRYAKADAGALADAVVRLSRKHGGELRRGLRALAMAAEDVEDC